MKQSVGLKYKAFYNTTTNNGKSKQSTVQDIYIMLLKRDKSMHTPEKNVCDHMLGCTNF